MSHPNRARHDRLANTTRRQRRKDRRIGFAMAAVVAAGALLLVGDGPSEAPGHAPGLQGVDGPAATMQQAQRQAAAPRGSEAALRQGTTGRSAAPRLHLASPSRVVPVAMHGPRGAYEVAAGEVLVRPATGADRPALRRELEDRGVRWVQEGYGTSAWRLGFDPTRPVAELVAEVASIAGLHQVGANAVMRGAASGNGQAGSPPGDEPSSDLPDSEDCGPGDLVDYQWDRELSAVPEECPGEDSDLSPAVIAVLDSGVAYETWSDLSGDYVASPELAGVPVVAPFDFINGDEHANDDNQHGTHIAGIIASRDRLRGHAPNPVLMPVKVLDHDQVGTEWSLISGINWAIDNGAQIINLSLSFGLGYTPSPGLAHALDSAEVAGVLVVAAAGNDGGERVAYPAAYPGVMAVGAMKPADRWKAERALYSNAGWPLDVMAAGGDLSDDADNDGLLDGVLAQTISPEDPTQMGYWLMAGTSQATAVASAQASVALGMGVTGRELRDALVDNATPPGGGTGFSYTKGGGVIQRNQLVGALDSSGPQSGWVPPPPVYVNVAQAMTWSPVGGWELLARVEVVNELGVPIPDATVYSHAMTSTHSADFASTGLDGVVTFSVDTGAMGLDEPALGVFSVDAVVWGASGFDMPLQPGTFHRMTEGGAAVLGAAAEGAEPGSSVVFLVDPTNPDVCEAFDCTDMQASYLLRNYGGGFAGSIVNVSFNDPYFNELKGSGFAGSLVNVGFASPLWLSGSMAQEGSYEEILLDGSGFAGSLVYVVDWQASSTLSLGGQGFAGSLVDVFGSYGAKTLGTFTGDAFDALIDGSGFAGSIVNVYSFSSASGLYASDESAMDATLDGGWSAVHAQQLGAVPTDL